MRSLLLLNSLPSPGPWGVAASSTDRCVSDNFAHVRFAVLGISRLVDLMSVSISLHDDPDGQGALGFVEVLAELA